jgi:hypothetical protein
VHLSSPAAVAAAAARDDNPHQNDFYRCLDASNIDDKNTFVFLWSDGRDMVAAWMSEKWLENLFAT